MPKRPTVPKAAYRQVFAALRAGLLAGNRPAAFADAAQVAPNPALRKALRAHAALARRLKKSPPKAAPPTKQHQARLAGSTSRLCALCRLPVPHASKDEWRKHFRVASSRKGNYALLRRYDTHDKRLAWTVTARAAARRRHEDRWLGTLDPRTVKVLGRRQALIQAITALNRLRDRNHQIQLPT